MPVPEGQNCTNCRFYVQGPNPGQGMCQRDPPVGPIVDSEWISNVPPIFASPAVDASGWCGEWKAQQ